MATIKDVRNLLRHLDPKVGRKSGGAYPFVYKKTNFSIKESDVDEYLQSKPNLSFPHETAISSTGYYEHVVEFQGFRAPPIRSRLRGGVRDSLEIENKEKTENIELSTISPLFLLSILDKEEQSCDFLRYLMRPMMMGRFRDEDDVINLCDFVRIHTIRLKIDPSVDRPPADKTKESIVESALFNFAYNYGFASILSKSWEREYFRIGRKRSDITQYPLRIYKSDLLAYYQLALSSESMVLAYLALYKIVEYFYTSASEKVLHGKIRDKLVLPDFYHTKPKQLRELVSLIRKNDQKTDERRMLLNVLEEYFDAAETKEWVEEHDAENHGYYTESKDIFGEEHKIDTNPSQIFSTVASRVYHIRNAIVHNKESEVSRFIPFSGQEQLLFNEMALLRFIAEGLIVKTGKDR